VTESAGQAIEHLPADPLLTNHLGRSVALSAWLLIGWFVVER
jgi:hypothetical protein